MGAESAFYVMDAGEVLRLWDVWTAAMPRVHPFYAVKCNPDKALLGLLASLGAGFDVASLAELEVVS
ncbi:type III PLP-dependent enzyme, partial [bacterium]|nr:type III PLP-dependent enzyme [bacterium]